MHNISGKSGLNSLAGLSSLVSHSKNQPIKLFISDIIEIKCNSTHNGHRIVWGHEAKADLSIYAVYFSISVTVKSCHATYICFPFGLIFISILHWHVCKCIWNAIRVVMNMNKVNYLFYYHFMPLEETLGKYIKHTVQLGYKLYERTQQNCICSAPPPFPPLNLNERATSFLFQNSEETQLRAENYCSLKKKKTNPDCSCWSA